MEKKAFTLSNQATFFKKAEQNVREVKKSKIKKKGVKKRVQTTSACKDHHRSVAEWQRLVEKMVILLLKKN